ncbi:hypothetical protein R6Q57_028713 [Mikania cordata]
MGDDHATHSDKDHTLDGNTNDPFDSTQYNISCSMMDELEKSVLSKYDCSKEKGKTICDIGASNDVPSFDLMLSQITPVNQAHTDPVYVDPIPSNPAPVIQYLLIQHLLKKVNLAVKRSRLEDNVASTIFLVDSHYKDDVEEVDRITAFTENMEICLKLAELDSLIGVDMLLIPMLHACHYYVLCFNLNKAQFFVIDNIGTDMDFDIKYAKRPQIMQSTLCSYLVLTSHPIAFTLKTCKPKRLSMPWRTLNNSADCGVFAMRHMETFKGTSVKEWKCGLTSESDKQQKQLNDLRIKYLAKILLSDINIHKGEVVSEVRAYMNLPNDVKEKMREGVFERIKHRVRSTF